MNKKSKLLLILLCLGFIFIALDIHVYTGIKYPNQYKTSKKVTGEYQYYNIYTNYGADCTYKVMKNKMADAPDISPSNFKSSGYTSDLQSALSGGSAKVIDKVSFKSIRIDIFGDIIGFILIAIASLMVIKTGRSFIIAFLSSIAGIILRIILFVLPFLSNSYMLCHYALLIGLAYLFCNLFAVMFSVYGLQGMCKGVVVRDERRWTKYVWYIIFTAQILVTFVNWIGSDYPMLKSLNKLIIVALVAMIILLFKLFNRAIDYIQKSYDEVYHSN